MRGLGWWRFSELLQYRGLGIAGGGQRVTAGPRTVRASEGGGEGGGGRRGKGGQAGRVWGPQAISVSSDLTQL